MTEESLFPTYTVHCFLALRGCDHVVRATDPRAAHDEMEEHYRDAHAAWIAAAIGELS